MAENFRPRTAPGVYVTEIDAFPPSIVGVETAVPIFIGYTEKAEINGKPVTLKPVKINSLADYGEIFGAGPEPSIQIDDGTADHHDVEVSGAGGKPASYFLVSPAGARFFLYDSLRLFYAQGGGAAYVVSVGTYEKSPTAALGDLQKGLEVAGDQRGATMTVIPDATLLPASGATPSGLPTSDDFATLAQAMLKQCGNLGDRMALLDVYGTTSLDPSDDFDKQLDEIVDRFHADVGSESLSYGAAYFPFLNTSIVSAGEIDYTDFSGDGQVSLADVLNLDNDALYTGDQHETVAGTIDSMKDTLTPPEAVAALEQNLRAALPVLGEMESAAAAKLGVLPPSGALAGVCTQVDQSRGVWNAPANVSLAQVQSPTVHIDNQQQGDLNAPVDGKAIDALREFQGRGTVVWGARTLDGNSQDWRYIQVRRTIIYIEQSIEQALDPFVFAANDGNTWTTVVSMISGFLQGLWSQGGLMGATASEAFTVECGLGSTMTAQDILEGYMIVQVTLQMIRPAEFIELTFKQKMEGAG